MNLRKLSDFIKKPFVNLTSNARGLLILRLSTCALTLFFLIFIIGIPYALHNLYVAKLECSHVDVASGLFAALKASADDLGYTGNGESLTTSEVFVLTEYTEEQVEDAPQFIYSNLMNWCFGTYNLTEDSEGHISHHKKDAIYNLQCTNTDLNYVFDYRGELSVIGLNIILWYVYGDQYISLASNQPQYVPDDSYMRLKALRRHFNTASHNLLFFASGLNALMIVFTLVYYSKRAYEKDDHKMPLIFRHAFAVASLISWITITIAVVIITIMYHIIQRDVRNELGTYGLSVHLGIRWFALAWLSVSVSLFNLFSWAGPIWWYKSNTNKLILDTLKGSGNYPLNPYHDDFTTETNTPNENNKTHKDRRENISMQFLNKDELPLMETDSNGTEVIREDYLSETPLISNSEGLFIDPYYDSIIPTNMHLKFPQLYDIVGDRYGNVKAISGHTMANSKSTVYLDAKDEIESNSSQIGLGLDDSVNETLDKQQQQQQQQQQQHHQVHNNPGLSEFSGSIRDLTRKESQNSNRANGGHYMNNIHNNNINADNKRSML